MGSGHSLPGRRWRSSQAFIVFTATLGLFSETFLYAFIVPILSYMVEVRLGLPSSQTQGISSALFTSYGLMTVVSAPIIAHFADKTPNRRTPLLISLAGCLGGTIMLAVCSSVWMLFVGRLLQAVSGSAAFIVCFATIADNVPSERMGRVLGTAMSFVTAGIVTGPAVSGVLLEKVGYWAAWSTPLSLLGFGFIARLLMLERKNNNFGSMTDDTEEAEVESSKASSINEVTSLLATNNDSYIPAVVPNFYWLMLRDIRIVVGLLNTFAFSTILTSFDTVLALHLQRLFHWGPMFVGLSFLGLQVPGMALGPLVGHMRDNIGPRYPSALGWVLIALFLCVMGLPGSDMKLIDTKLHGEAVFISGMVGIGISSPLVRGTGTFQIVAMTNQLRADNPNLFGPHGATSRIFSLTEVAMNIGSMIGPLLSGVLVETLGFQHMVSVLALMSLVVGVLSFIFLAKRFPKRRL